MAKNPIDQKKAEKLKIMGNSVKEFLKSVLILFITVIICTYVALNIIFSGYLPAEIIFPTSPCMPPYMSNDPAKCHRSYDLTSPNNIIDRKDEEALFSKCKSNQFSKRWEKGKSLQSKKIINKVQMSNKKYQSWEYRSASEFITSHGDSKSNSNIIMKFLKLTLRVLLAKTFINTRKNFHVFHNAIGGLFNEGKLKFGLLLIILIFMMNTGTFFPLFGAIYTILGILTMIHYVIVAFEDYFWCPFFAILPLIFMLPLSQWASLWIMRDFVYHYVVSFLFNSNIRAVLSCKLKDYWPVISVVFVFFSLLKASTFLDNTTVSCMWLVFIIMVFMNRKKILYTIPNNDAPIGFKSKPFGCSIDI